MEKVELRHVLYFLAACFIFPSGMFYISYRLHTYIQQYLWIDEGAMIQYFPFQFVKNALCVRI